MGENYNEWAKGNLARKILTNLAGQCPHKF